MKDLSKLGFKAVNLYFSALCNLRCRYCFQPKIHEIGLDINKKIIEWISSGKMEDDILKYFGDDIECLTLWGGEPSINLPYLTERLPYIYDKFKSLKEIFWSTNASAKKLIQNSIDLVKEAVLLNESENRKVIIRIQFSIDGPPEINDKNRLGSKADSIMENISYLLEELKDTPPEYFSLSFKGTQSSEDLRWLTEGDNLFRFYTYFDDYCKEWLSRGIPERIIPGHCNFITLVYPGDYTKEDGLNFAELIRKQNSKEFQERRAWSRYVCFDNQITSRVKEMYDALLSGYYRDYKGELLSHCSCCAGRSQLGLTYNSQMHLCQDTYLSNDDVLNYIKENNLITEFEEKYGYSFRKWDRVIKNNIAVSYEDDIRASRLLYKMNSCVKYLTPRIQFLEIIISELAAAGQISECFNLEEWRDLAISYFLFGGTDCPVGNIWEFSSPYVRSTAQIKLTLNGAFEYYINTFYKDILGFKDINKGNTYKWNTNTEKHI